MISASFLVLWADDIDQEGNSAESEDLFNMSSIYQLIHMSPDRLELIQ